MADGDGGQTQETPLLIVPPWRRILMHNNRWLTIPALALILLVAMAQSRSSPIPPSDELKLIPLNEGASFSVGLLFPHHVEGDQAIVRIFHHQRVILSHV